MKNKTLNIAALIASVALALFPIETYGHKCKDCKDKGYSYKYMSCEHCKGTGMKLDNYLRPTHIRCQHCSKLDCGNKLGYVKTKVKCSNEVHKYEKTKVRRTKSLKNSKFEKYKLK